MAHEHREEIGRLLWAGKYREAIRLHQDAYEKNPEGECVPFASTLYSSLSVEGVRQMLLDYIRAELYQYALRLSFDHDAVQAIDQADVISTIILWAVDQDGIDETVHASYLATAEMLVGEAIRHASACECAPHSFPLLLLTKAGITLRITGGHSNASVVMDLYTAKNLSSRIVDPRQKERVLRKAGMLFWEIGSMRVAYRCFFEALFVPHGAFGVKAKTLAAIAGFRK